MLGRLDCPVRVASTNTTTHYEVDRLHAFPAALDSVEHPGDRMCIALASRSYTPSSNAPLFDNLMISPVKHKNTSIKSITERLSARVKGENLQYHWEKGDDVVVF